MLRVAAMLASLALGSAPAPDDAEAPPPRVENDLSTRDGWLREQKLGHLLAAARGEGTLEERWELAGALTQRRAYCWATSILQRIEAQAGAIAHNRASAAQAFYMCAKTRLGQGDTAQAHALLARSIKLVGQRLEHQDLLFKLALVRAKEAMHNEDLAAVRENLEEAKRHGADTGPGASGRLAPWAVPIFHDAVRELAGWSHELLARDKRQLAQQASSLALAYNPQDKIAQQVQRDLVLGGELVTALGWALGALLLALLGWRLARAHKLKKVAEGIDF